MRESIQKEYPELVDIEKIIYDRYKDETEEYKRDMYEIINLFNDDKDIDLENLGWNNKSFIEFHNEEKEEEYLEAVSGIMKCFSCGSDKIQSFNKQTRGGDEGTTVFARCTQCGKGWKENG